MNTALTQLRAKAQRKGYTNTLQNLNAVIVPHINAMTPAARAILAPCYKAAFNQLNQEMDAAGQTDAALAHKMNQFHGALIRAHQLEILLQQAGARNNAAVVEFRAQEQQFFDELRRGGVTPADFLGYNEKKAYILDRECGAKNLHEMANKPDTVMNFFKGVKNLVMSFGQPDENVRKNAMFGLFGAALSALGQFFGNMFKNLFGAKYAPVIDEIVNEGPKAVMKGLGFNPPAAPTPDADGDMFYDANATNNNVANDAMNVGGPNVLPQQRLHQQQQQQAQPSMMNTIWNMLPNNPFSSMFR